MEYPNKKLSFWCKILTQMKKAMFYRKESIKRAIFRPVLTAVFLMQGQMYCASLRV